MKTPTEFDDLIAECGADLPSEQVADAATLTALSADLSGEDDGDDDPED